MSIAKIKELIAFLFECHGKLISDLNFVKTRLFLKSRHFKLTKEITFYYSSGY